MSKTLGPLLLQAGIMSSAELEASLDEARKRRITLFELIIHEKRVSEESLAETLSKWLNLPQIRLASATVDPKALRAVSEEMARKHSAMPVKVERNSLVVAMSDPSDFNAIQEIGFASGLSVRPVVASRSEVLDAIDRYYTTEDKLHDFLSNVTDATDLNFVSEAPAGVDLDGMDAREAAQLAPVVRMVNLLIQDAIKSGASDVHVEPGLNNLQVRLRVDGVLRDYMQVPKWLHAAVTSRLKILADLDIAERRLPQDGRIKAQFQGKSLDIRVSTLPTHFGEKVVMRVLGTNQIPTFRAMGLTDEQCGVLEGALNQPQGMILVTGPTGSGKTTGLYSMLTKRKSPEVNIVTVEDPIEYQLGGITQVQVNTKTGLTFPKVLRSVLRQDPDVILVGEIRDLETAEIAFRAAMTGHLVLSTVHTNSALATVTRLLDLGVDPVLFTSSVQLIVAQRLARRICMRCKEAYTPAPDVLAKLRLEGVAATFYRGRGCAACGRTGYAGRVGIFEMVRMTPKLKDLIQRKATEAELRKAAVATGTRFLADDAMEKLKQGVTSPDEVLRVIQFDEDDMVRCPECAAFIHLDFSTCPYCLHSLKELCEGCGQELKLEWRVCPYCNARKHAVTTDALDRPRTGPIRRRTATPMPRSTGGAGAAAARWEGGGGIGVAGGVDLGAPIVTEWAMPRTAPRTAPRARPAATVKRPNVLVVDHDPGILQGIEAALSTLPIGVDVMAMPSAEDALASVSERLPDLVITEVGLAGMDGFELCRHLREDIRTAFVPVVMLANPGEEQARSKGYHVGADDYVSKPFSSEDLNSRVLRLLRRTYGI